jgi:hypothetical protein
MTANEATLFAVLAVFGVVVGFASGRYAAKKTKGMPVAIAGALLPAVFATLFYGFVLGFSNSWQPHGFSLGSAILAGVGGMFYFGLGMSLLTGITSLASACASYAIFTKCAAKSKKEPIKITTDNDGAAPRRV